MIKIKNLVLLKIVLINQYLVSINFPLKIFDQNAVQPIYKINVSIANIEGGALEELSKKILEVHVKSSLLNESKQKFSAFSTYLNSNKEIIASLGISTIFLYPLYEICKMNNYMKNKETWSSWKSELSTEKLISMQAKEMSKEISNEVQKRYTIVSNRSNNMFVSFNVFVNNIDKEIDFLNSYTRLIYWIKFFHLCKIYQISDDVLNKVDEKIKRLNYLKNVFNEASVSDLKI